MKDYLSLMHSLKTKATKYGLDLNGPIKGCSEAEIQVLEQKYQCVLPAAYRAYLLVMGKNPPRLLDVDIGYDYDTAFLEKEDGFYLDMLRYTAYEALGDLVLFFAASGQNFSFLMHRYTEDDDPVLYMVNDSPGVHHTIPDYIPKHTGFTLTEMLRLQINEIPLVSIVGAIAPTETASVFGAENSFMDRAIDAWYKGRFSVPHWARLDNYHDWDNIQLLSELDLQEVEPFTMELQSNVELSFLCKGPFSVVRQLKAPDTVGLNLYSSYQSKFEVYIRGACKIEHDQVKYLAMAKLMYEWLQMGGPENCLSFVYSRSICELQPEHLKANTLGEIIWNDDEFGTDRKVIFIYESQGDGWRLYIPYSHFVSNVLFSAETMTTCFQHFIDFVDKLLAWNFPQRPAVQVKHLYTHEYPEWVRLRPDYLSYMQDLKARAIKYGLTDNGPIEGCSEAEIQVLEDKFNYPLPAAFRAYLAVMGKTPPYLLDVNAHYDYEAILDYPDEEDYPYPYLLRNSAYSKLTDAVVFFAVRGSEDHCYLFYKYGLEADPILYMIYHNYHIQYTIDDYIPRTIGLSFCEALELIIEGRHPSLSFSKNRHPLDDLAIERWETLQFTIPDWVRLDDCYDWEHIQRLDALKPELVSPFEMQARQDLSLNILCLAPYRLPRRLQEPDTVGLTSYATYLAPLQVRVNGETVYYVDARQYLSLAKLMCQWLYERGSEQHLSFVYTSYNCCLSEYQLHLANINDRDTSAENSQEPIILIYEEAHHGWRLHLPTYEYMSPEVFSAETLKACFQHFIDFVDKLLAWNFPQRPAVQVKHLYTKEYPEWVRLPAAEHRK